MSAPRRITVSLPEITRRPWQWSENWIQPTTLACKLGDFGRWRQSCWVWFKGGRLHVARESIPPENGLGSHTWGQWLSIEFVPKTVGPSSDWTVCIPGNVNLDYARRVLEIGKNQ